MGRLLKVACLCLVVVVVLAAGGAAALLYSDWGHERVRLQANRLVSDYIAGNLHIEHVDAIELPRVCVRGVTISDPTGDPVIVAKRVDMELDVDAIMDGRFAWHRADIEGGMVHVHEDGEGRINMARTFREAHPSASEDADAASDEAPLDLRGMATSGIELRIDGGSLPSLRMTGLNGIMRVHVLPSGDVELPFSRYEGHFVKGLPTGKLDFHAVEGWVHSSGKRLLHFEGDGKSEGEAVHFVLNIDTAPKTEVAIDARFPNPSAESIATQTFGMWTKFMPSLDLQVKHGPAKGD